MKKFTVLILVLVLLCGILSGCSREDGIVSDRDIDEVTDTPRDDGAMGDDDILDNDDNAGTNGGKTGSGNQGDNDAGKDNAGNGGKTYNNDGAVPTSIPGENSTVATQPVTP